MKYKIGLIFSKKDYVYNIDNYGKKYNLFFITGMVGAGKSTIAKEISSKYNATILSQDWLSWSEVYKNDKNAMKILEEFYKICPEAETAAKNNLWHRELLSKEKRQEIRKRYNDFLIRYSSENPRKLFIIEGIDIYKVVDFKELMNRGFIIKGSSAIRCFIRRYKRDKIKYQSSGITKEIEYFKMVIKESKVFYFRDRKFLNNLINNINSL